MENNQYLCKCGELIKEGDAVHLIHIRHGEIIGEAEGTYNGVCSVYEKTGFDNATFNRTLCENVTNPNSPSEIEKSCLELDDSESKVQGRRKLFAGKPVSSQEYYLMVQKDRPEWATAPLLKRFDLVQQEYEQLENAPKLTAKSGLVMYHKECYDTACQKNAVDLTPTRPVPDTFRAFRETRLLR